jgi:hypothetical protein
VEGPSVVKEITEADIAPLLSQTPCSALRASVNGEGVQVKGYARWQDEAQLKKALISLAGPDKIDLSAIQTLDRGKCSAIDILSTYWAANQELAPPTSIESRSGKDTYVAGEHLVLDIATPDYPSFVNVDYYMLDGGVLHLIPSPRFSANQAPASYQATIGDLGEWAIAKPFGTEMVVIMATPEPLFDAMRKEYESQKDYLPALKRRLAQIAEKEGEDKVAADILLIRTKDR